METCKNRGFMIVHWPAWKRSRVCADHIQGCVNYALRHGFTLIYEKDFDVAEFKSCGFSSEGLEVFQQTKIMMYTAA